eukprot:TRINITY_DN26160_c0_g1_i2.p1 TRINITY_DN26160_c0_g1~~TRINITY_DN26160_c0_g1_i2.p1  ORF type:complete len:619 (+),score=211.43 TRINITY_DN26160_c0_g1_i2:87-1943(+)
MSGSIVEASVVQSELEQPLCPPRDPAFAPQPPKRRATLLQAAVAPIRRVSGRSPPKRKSLVRTSSGMREEYLDARFAALADERAQRRIRAELGEACEELRALAALMEKTKNFELRQDTLSNWSARILERVGIVEGHVHAMLQQQSAPRHDGDGGEQQDGSGRSRSMQRDADTPLTTDAPDFSVSGFHVPVTTSLYLCAEAIAHQLRAERASVFQFVPRSDELQAVCVVNSGTLRPSSVRCSALTGWAGQVFSTGVAVNVSNAYAHVSGSEAKHTDKKTGYRTRSILCFPITGLGTRRRVGVVQLLNKNRGNSNFSSEDEGALAAMTGVLSYLMLRYPADTLNNYFDPTSLHRVIPLQAPEAQPSMLPASVTKNTPQLIYRTSHSGQVVARARGQMINEGTPLDENVTLMEVDAYLSKLEECWQRSVMLNMEYEREVAGGAEKEKELREHMRQGRDVKRRLLNEISAKEIEMQELQSKVQRMEQGMLEAKPDTEGREEEGQSASPTQPDAESPGAAQGEQQAQLHSMAVTAQHTGGLPVVSQTNSVFSAPTRIAAAGRPPAPQAAIVQPHVQDARQRHALPKQAAVAARLPRGGGLGGVRRQGTKEVVISGGGRLPSVQ